MLFCFCYLGSFWIVHIITASVRIVPKHWRICLFFQMKAARAKFSFQAQSPKWVTAWADVINVPFPSLQGHLRFLKRNHYIIALSDIIIKSKTHILFISHTHLEVWTDFSLACLMTFTPFCLQGAHAAERRHRLHPQAGRCQLVWRGTSRQSWHFPHNLRGGKYLHIISRHCSTVLVIWFLLTQTCYRCPS